MTRRPGAALDPAALAQSVRAGDRRALARAITLIESTRDDHRVVARELLDLLVSASGGAIRIGITGAPGVGKSTFIEAFGLALLAMGQRVAVLAVDPSSPVTGGSILGDKTRMERLAQEPGAFIRPSPSGGSPGGVAHRTREALLVCEAAGHDVVIVETVGVGQSEVAVASMVDSFVVLLQPGAGDELQGVKKGVIELADLIVVNKADGENEKAAARTRQQYQNALDLLRGHAAGWRPRVLCASALAGSGIRQVWETIGAHRRALDASGEFAARRRRQARSWMWSLVEEGLSAMFRATPAVAAQVPGLERDVEAQQLTPAAAATRLLDAFRSAGR